MSIFYFVMECEPRPRFWTPKKKTTNGSFKMGLKQTHTCPCNSKCDNLYKPNIYVVNLQIDTKIHYKKIGVWQLSLQLGFGCNFELQRPLVIQHISIA